MTNPHKGDVSFDVGGKTYTLRYSHFALVKLESVLDKSLVQVMDEVSKPQTLRLRTVVALLWAGLQKHHPSTTEEQAADLLDEIDGGFPEAMKHIDAAFGKAFGATPGTKGTNPIQTANGSGTTSSSSTSVSGTTPMPSGTSPLAN